MERFETFWKKYFKTAVDPRKVLLGPDTADNKVKVEDCKAAYSHALAQAKDEIKRLEKVDKENYTELAKLREEIRKLRSEVELLTNTKK